MTMNAPLRSDAVAIPLPPATTVFRVRPRTPLAFDIVVEMVGPHVLPTGEKAPVVARGLYGAEAANAAAQALADAFEAEHPDRPVDVEPAPGTPRRSSAPGAAFARFVAATTLRRRFEQGDPDDPVRVERAERHMAYLRSLP